ncbi:MAG TPA: hypothetical protein VM223_14790, partial [Planctomycetota bacterium]|nr:hypothetical protein [Planctomycetota bacterium]
MNVTIRAIVACGVLAVWGQFCHGGENDAGGDEVRRQAFFFRTSNTIAPPQGRRIAIDDHDRVYILNYRSVWPNNKPAPNWNGGWLVYSSSGDFIGEFWGITGGSAYSDIAAIDGRLYVPCAWVGPQVFVFGADEGQALLTVPLPAPFSAAGAPDKSFWATNTKENRVDHYDQFGKLLGSIPAQNPQRVRISPVDGRVFIEVPGVGVEAYSPAGEKQGMIPGGPLYNCTLDGNVISGFTIYTPAGEKVRDIRLEGFEQFGLPPQSLAVDSKGNAYVGVADPHGRLAFVSYDAGGKFRFARGADCDMMEAAIPSRVLEAGKNYDVPVSFETTRDKGWLAPNQIVPGERGEAPVFSAFVRNVAGGDWRPVEEFARQRAGVYGLRLQAMMSGTVYTLRITSASEAEPVGSNALQCDLLIGVPSGLKLGSLAILSDRKRSVWRCGEDVPFCCVAKSAGKQPRQVITLRLEESGSRRIIGERKRVPFDAEAGANTIALAVPGEVTAVLEPGIYTIRAGGTDPDRSRDEFDPGYGFASWDFELAPAASPKPFLMAHYPEVNEDDLPAELAVNSVDVIARRGFNLDIRQVYSVASRREALSMRAPELRDADKLVPLLDENPCLPPPEVLYQPHRFDRYLQATTRRGIDSRLQLVFNETMIPYLPETWPDSQRQVQVFTQFASRWPSFAGWCFTGHAHVQSFAELG